TVVLGTAPAAGSHTFAVTNSGDASTASDAFVMAKSHITGITPLTVTHSGTAQLVTVAGSSFVNTGTGTLSVMVNGSATNVSAVTFFSASSITFKYVFATANPAFSMAVQVTNKDTTVSDIDTVSVNVK
ncbi:MAG: hypothetical protein JWN96_3109, partial [Mycobacterium sp.]|nr:hypothetical protein [Mycobacterium sp.]